MIILGIETSCDETAISVVENGSNLLSNVIRSQVEIHAQHGGIVPEIASRAHVAAIIPALQQSLNNDKLKDKEILLSRLKILKLTDTEKPIEKQLKISARDESRIVKKIKTSLCNLGSLF